MMKKPSVIESCGNTILEIIDVNKSYDNNQVLKNINLFVDDGELLILLGPSGCGKTTLLRIINGQILMDSGSIRLDGKDITNVQCSKRDMGFVFQSYALFPHMDVATNIAFGLRMRKIAKEKIESSVDDILKIVRLEGMGKRRINDLSGGQQQRVALARALVLCPKLLLMDEPLSNLDAKLRASVRVEIAEIQEKLGITTILVTHDQVEAMTMGDRIALMQDGVIQQISKPIDIYEYPTNIFVASFIGSPAINLFDVKIERNCVWFGGLECRLNLDDLRSLLKRDQINVAVSDKDYVLGVRPEDIMIYPNTEEKNAITDGIITYIEPLGSETVIHLDVAGRSIVSRIPRIVTDMNKSDRVKIGLHFEACHLFDKKTEKRV